MSVVGLHRSLAGSGILTGEVQDGQGNTSQGGRDKSTDRGRVHVVGCVGKFGVFWRPANRPGWRYIPNRQRLQASERHPQYLLCGFLQ